MRLLILPMLFLYKYSHSCASTASAANPVTTTSSSVTTTTSLSTDTTTTVIGTATTTTQGITTTTTEGTTTTTTAACEAGWELFEGFCYFLGTNMVFEAEAEADCEAMGATLASIHSAAENTFVNNLVGGMTAWIGVTRSCATPADLTCFQNIDGTPFDFSMFRASQPDNFGGGQNCMQINWAGNTGVWDDNDCTASLTSSASQYVCKKPL